MLKSLKATVESYPHASIVITALLARLLLAVCYQQITIFPDSEGYIGMADMISSLNLESYEGKRTIGYPFLLLLSGGSAFTLALWQVALGIATLLMAYNTLLLLDVKPSWALYASLFLAAYTPIIFFEYAVLSETITIFTITFIFWTYFAKQRKGASTVLIILACCFLILIKPFYIFLPILLFLFSFSKVLSVKGIAGKIGLLLMPFFIYWGVCTFNEAVVGKFTPTTFYGYNLAQCCVLFAEKTAPRYAEIGAIYAKHREELSVEGGESAMSIWRAEEDLRAATNQSFVQLSETLYQYSLATIQLNALAYAKQVMVSWGDFWKTSFYYDDTEFGDGISDSIVILLTQGERILFQLVKIFFVVLIPFNLYRMVKNKRIDAAMVISIVVLVASVLQAMVTYGTNSRFSYPFEILILTSVLLNVYGGYIKKKS